MAPQFETIVLGLGAAGSATLYQLAKRGRSVLGIDRFSPPHGEGSSHGDTRITRLAIGEGAQYTPLALRAHEIWRELEKETGRSLLTTDGALILSSAARTSVTHVATFFANTLAAAKRFEIAHEILDANALRRRFPLFNVADDEIGYFEPSAGFVRPEECIRAQLDLAEAKGATIHRDETVLGFDASDARVTVTTDRAAYSCAHLIVAAGAWLPEWMGRDVARWFKVYRQVLYWFDIEGDAAEYALDRFPVFIWELQGKPQGVYGFPAIDGPRGGLKVSTESFGATTTPQTVTRTVTPEEIAAMHRDYVAPYLRGVGARCLRATTCLYTVTPDFGFVIDRHPRSDRVIVASPCSGHGFKHSAAVGEALAQWIVDGQSRIDLGAFALRRFDSLSPTGG
ncbi:MAG TPA: N-methyl-L-tryptophan oxidase [Casimicrobiaceae bacterium]